MKNIKSIKFDLSKEAKRASRNFFKGKPAGSFAHKNKKSYSRKNRSKDE